MEEEEERVDYLEEEVTTIHRKTIRKQSTTRRRKQKYQKNDGNTLRGKLNPFIVGAKNREAHNSDVPLQTKPDHVIKLVQETLNEYRGKELPVKIKNTNRVFLGAFDSDDEEEDQNRNGITVSQDNMTNSGRKVSSTYCYEDLKQWLD